MQPPVTLAERILAHLAAHPVAADAVDVPREVTQDGIAENLGARVAHISRALKALVQQGLVAARIARPRGGKRRSRVHALTDAGQEAARRLGPLSGPPARVARAAPGAATPRPPVAREHEFATLVKLLEEASVAGPRLCLVEGESGIGKTSLLQAYRVEAERRGARVVWADSAPAGGEQLLGPVRTALEPIGFDRAFRAQAAGTMHERALAAALDVVGAAQRRQPLVVALDDLHLAGPGVAEFLHGLVLGLSPGSRVLLLAAFRQEEAWAMPNGPLYTSLLPLKNDPASHHLLVGPLPREGIARLLEDAGVHVLGNRDLPADLVERVWRESGGNPSYALAMGEALADGVDESDFFPVSIQGAAKERFGSLPSGELAVLQLAAVAGAETDYGILARAHEGDEDVLVHLLDRLLDRLLLEEAPSHQGDLRLRFRHPKVRQAVLTDMSATRRRFLEGRVAQAHASAPS